LNICGPDWFCWAGWAAHCLFDRTLPTGVARERDFAPARAAAKNHIVFFGRPDDDNTLAPSLWLCFLHWNNSRIENAYCINGF
jgi:hypothetical protein